MSSDITKRINKKYDRFMVYTPIDFKQKIIDAAIDRDLNVSAFIRACVQKNAGVKNRVNNVDIHYKAMSNTAYEERLTFVVPKGEKSAIVERAIEEGLTISSFIRKCIEKELSK